MHLADHIRPLLRDHDCVIIPDFGGLVADISPARAQPGRQALSPPTKLVAFNQALTRNDGLLVDALSQHLGLPIAEARERVRAAVAGLQQELDESNRTELPGIGIFRRAAGRGLSFEYTGTDNLLAASFGLPELAARPVRVGDSRKLPQPVLRGARTRLGRFVPAGVIAVAVSLLLLANYQVALKAGYLPTALRTSVPKWEWAQRHAETVAVVTTEPQQAALGQHDFGTANAEASEGLTPISAAPTAVPEMAATNDSTGTPVRKVPVVRAETGTNPAPTASSAAAPEVAEAPAESVAPAPVAAVVAAPRKAAVANSSTIKTPTGRFYVVAGAYTSLARAEQGRRNLLHAGHPARIILPHFGTRLFRLTAGDYADQASAQREAQRLRVSTHCDYITLKY
ncbi:SPOR domain-containing protein [Hymenobacter sp. DH14]|uniref:SPOR domain-containing protein n=1 Tax=Hymenobacter cyanobacteriorum TaxID=2926463 RepID=A0A9X1VE58_9BACT|nr:SPOR domain-containing protein [Hymenobacter cyanobacteriorum]MCI1187519.1 SPOR domain-containing protein [Hymenobacter cyanobacteriorum]